MLRRSAVRLLVMMILAGGVAWAGVAWAGESGNNPGKDRKDRMQAVVSEVDRQTDTITVSTTDQDGKKQTTTLHIGKDAKLLTSDGRSAKLDNFRPGDNVCITKHNDHVTEIRKHAEATITKINPKAGEITVKMPDRNGKEIEKTFELVEDAEYLDSSGRVAVLDVFKSGDDILIIESDGRVQAMKKAPSGDDANTARSDSKKSTTR